MTTNAVERDTLTLAQIDEMLTHHAKCLHADPDPLSRWERIILADKWLDTRLRFAEMERQQQDDDPA